MKHVSDTNNNKSDVQPKQLLAGVGRYHITGREMKRILEGFGASQKDFAVYVGRTQQWVSMICSQSADVLVKYRWAVKLEEYVGIDIYENLLLDERAKRKKLFETRQKAIL